jgi:hypothetical protein
MGGGGWSGSAGRGGEAIVGAIQVRQIPKISGLPLRTQFSNLGSIIIVFKAALKILNKFCR